jgi:hypothetical protein
MEMPRADRLYVIVDEEGQPLRYGEGEDYTVAVYADRLRATRDTERAEASLLTLTPEVLKVALEGPWAESITHVVYNPESLRGHMHT